MLRNRHTHQSASVHYHTMAMMMYSNMFEMPTYYSSLTIYENYRHVSYWHRPIRISLPVVQNEQHNLINSIHVRKAPTDWKAWYQIESYNEERSRIFASIEEMGRGGFDWEVTISSKALNKSPPRRKSKQDRLNAEYYTITHWRLRT